MKDWFERACDELEMQLEDGVITLKEFNEEMRWLREEYRDCAREDAQDTYDSYF